MTINGFERLETGTRTEIDQWQCMMFERELTSNRHRIRSLHWNQTIWEHRTRNFGQLPFNSLRADKTLRIWHRLHTKRYECWNSKMAPKDCWHLSPEDSFQGPRMIRCWPPNNVDDFPSQYVFWAGFGSSEILRGEGEVSSNSYHYPN